MINMSFSDEAQCVFEKFCSAVEESLRPGHDLQDLRDWGSKYPGQTVRIAGNLHAIECAHEDMPLETPITAETLLKAISIGEFYKAHSIAAFGFMEADARMLDAQDLLKRLNRNEFKVAERDLWRSARNKYNSDRARFQAALEVLRDHHYIKIIRRSTDGRPSNEVHINPRCRKTGDKSAERGFDTFGTNIRGSEKTNLEGNKNAQECSALTTGALKNESTKGLRSSQNPPQ